MASPSRRLADIDAGLLERLNRAWQPARDAGAMGGDSIEDLRRHARGYILDEWRTLGEVQFVDCGAGAGALGILLALELPATRWFLVDASDRRCEMARRAVAAAGLADRVTVRHSSLDELARGEHREGFAGAVARSFGPAPELAECALPLLGMGASLVVSVSETTMQQWQRMALAARTGCEVVAGWTVPSGRYLAVRRSGPVPAEFPRRRPARLRSPLD